jgi:hypothetical protein
MPFSENCWADAAIVYFHLALRYTRIFSDLFDFIPLGGTREQPQPYAENRVGKIHLGIVGDGGHGGPALLSSCSAARLPTYTPPTGFAMCEI